MVPWMTASVTWLWTGVWLVSTVNYKEQMLNYRFFIRKRGGSRDESKLPSRKHEWQSGREWETHWATDHLSVLMSDFKARGSPWSWEQQVWVNAASNQFMKSSKWCWQMKMLSVSLFTSQMFVENTSSWMLTNIYRLTGLKTCKESIWERISWDLSIFITQCLSFTPILPSVAFSALFVLLLLLQRWQPCARLCCCLSVHLRLCACLEPARPGLCAVAVST